jgi:GNAT superfamily N-acetyltransferase
MPNGPSGALLSELRVVRMGPGDAPELSRMLCEQPPAAREFFEPFPFEAEHLVRRLAGAVDDRYWAVYEGPSIVAFFMLRGWDEGFSVPAYGVLVSSARYGLGLGRFTLEWCRLWCRLNGVPEIMLKVHKRNGVAARLYEKFGFRRNGSSEGGRDWLFRLSVE